MRLIKELLEEQTEDATKNSEKPNVLTQHDMDHLQKLIKDGTKPDKETGQYQQWANALHLVHKAYEVAGIQRPTPDMPDLWKQYEENIQFAVTQLSKAHGINGDWRMSSSEFHK